MGTKIHKPAYFRKVNKPSGTAFHIKAQVYEIGKTKEVFLFVTTKIFIKAVQQDGLYKFDYKHPNYTVNRFSKATYAEDIETTPYDFNLGLTIVLGRLVKGMKEANAGFGVGLLDETVEFLTEYIDGLRPSQV